jgi:hypothetical protein
MRAKSSVKLPSGTPAESLRATMAAVRVRFTWLGSLVGSTEANIRQALRIVDAMEMTAAGSVRPAAGLGQWTLPVGFSARAVPEIQGGGSNAARDPRAGELMVSRPSCPKTFSSLLPPS